MKPSKSRDKLHKEKITFTGSHDNVDSVHHAERAEFSFNQGKESMDKANKTGENFVEEQNELTDAKNSSQELVATQKIVIPQGQMLADKTEISTQQLMNESARPKSTLVNSKQQTKEQWFG